MPAPKGNQYAIGNSGRPDEYTGERAASICMAIVEGKSLRSIAKIEGMPSVGTILRWLNKYKEFQLQYARAKEEQTTSMAEDILEIAEQYSPESDILTPDLVQRARLRIDTRKWLMSKMAPKKYGEKVVNQHQGPDDEDGLPTAIEITIVQPN